MIVTDENNSSSISADGDKNSFGHGNGGESTEHGNPNEMNQMNIISAFLKGRLNKFKILYYYFSANPLPTFFNTSSSSPSKKPLGTKLDTGNSPPENLSPTNFSQSSSNTSSSSAIIPFSQDLISQGLLAVGGCRQVIKEFICE
jgi:hypothetical protein